MRPGQWWLHVPLLWGIGWVSVRGWTYCGQCCLRHAGENVRRSQRFTHWVGRERGHKMTCVWTVKMKCHMRRGNKHSISWQSIPVSRWHLTSFQSKGFDVTHVCLTIELHPSIVFNLILNENQKCGSNPTVEMLFGLLRQPMGAK